MCKSKFQGGLGVLDLALMNKALLAKWWIRFLDPTVKDKWKDLILAKYGNGGAHGLSSPFWKAILRDNATINLGLNKEIGNGNTTAFWLDRWCGDCALQAHYPHLFSIVTDRFILVANAFATSTLKLDFKRQLTGIYLQE